MTLNRTQLLGAQDFILLGVDEVTQAALEAVLSWNGFASKSSTPYVYTKIRP